MLPGGVRPRPTAPSVSVFHTPPLATYSSARYILLRSLHTPPFARRLRLAFLWRSVRPSFGASRRRASACHGAKCKCLTHCSARYNLLATYSSARYILLRSLHTPPFARRLRLAFLWRSVRPCFGASRGRALRVPRRQV